MSNGNLYPSRVEFEVHFNDGLTEGATQEVMNAHDQALAAAKEAFPLGSDVEWTVMESWWVPAGGHDFLVVRVDRTSL